MIICVILAIDDNGRINFGKIFGNEFNNNL